MSTGYFGPELFRFLRDLKANNRRDWFVGEKERYRRDVEAPMLQFIADLGPHLKRLSPRLRAIPTRVGGSMFRIYRDTRFSEDKSPFKTWVSARFTPEAPRDAGSVPAFYLHLEPGGSIGGGGIYHPDPPALRRIRERIATAPAEWRAVRRRKLDIEGESLQRVPAGFSPTHPLAADLKRKDHYVLRGLAAREVYARDFLETYAAECERVAPLVAFLSRALGVPW